MEIVEHIQRFQAWHLRNYLRIHQLTVEPGRSASEFGYMLLWCLRHWGLVEQFADQALSSLDAEYLASRLYRGQHGFRACYLKVLDDVVDERKTSRLTEHEKLSGLVRYTEAWEPEEHLVKTVYFMAEALRANCLSNYLAPTDTTVRNRIYEILGPWSREATKLFDEVVVPRYRTEQDVLDTLEID